MSQTGPRLVLLCACVLTLTVSVRSAPTEEHETRLRHQLAVQAAFEQGQDQLQRGNYEQAVAILEKQIAHIDGNRRYLMALRDAYRGYIRQLEAAGRDRDLNLFRDRLAILEPGGRPAKAATPAPVVTPPAKLPAAPQPAGGIVSRGKVEQDDPFAESNSAQSHRARGLMERAEGEFQAKRYDAAARLYALAESASPGCIAGCEERWAYCKLYVVAQALDRPGAADVASLERDVRQAVRMAPKLEGVAQKLLSRMREGSPAAGEATVAVRHTPRQGNGWAVAETDNIRVFHTMSQDQAEKVCQVAEATRVAMTRKWFGVEATRWSPRCDIYVHPTRDGYARATGAPPSSPGHSTISLEGGRVVARRVDVRSDDPNMIIGVLPHETTHVVLAGQFGTHHVPRWADEGMAVLSEPRQRIDLHLRNLPQHRREGTLFRLAELVRMADYPEPRRVGPFYAQSVSLVEFLVKSKGAPTFTRFLREGLDSGYEGALQRHYGYRSFADLEGDWLRQALGEGHVATASEKR